MEWPTQFLAAVLGLGIVALFIPWLVPRGFSVLLGLILALAATGCWGAYERHLQSIARPGDPLIRVDLILIVPLIALTWLSLLGLTVVRGRQAMKAESQRANDAATSSRTSSVPHAPPL
jgi:hypothetical protein